MANKAAGEMEVSINGKTHTLRPSFQAIMEFEDKAGITVFESMRMIGEKQAVPIKSVTAAFHAGIKAAWKPTMGKMPTFEEIGMDIRKDGISDHIQTYMQFLANMMTGERALEEAQKANPS